jgi:hypothetical protein
MSADKPAPNRQPQTADRLHMPIPSPTRYRNRADPSHPNTTRDVPQPVYGSAAISPVEWSRIAQPTLSRQSVGTPTPNREVSRTPRKLGSRAWRVIIPDHPTLSAISMPRASGPPIKPPLVGDAGFVPHFGGTPLEMGARVGGSRGSVAQRPTPRHMRRPSRRCREKYKVTDRFGHVLSTRSVV